MTLLSRGEIEDRCRDVHSVIGYKGRPVSLITVCDWQKGVTGLRVDDMRRAERNDAERGILGRITFEPPSIVVFFAGVDYALQRFTFAYALGHLLLGHGSYMKAESVDKSDLEKYDTGLGIDDLRHLKWQANYFASCLLVPHDALIVSADKHSRSMDLCNRGHGLIFVDNQRCNIENHDLIITALTKEFAVSPTTVSTRLKALGLLNDSRPRQIEARKLSGMRSPSEIMK